LNLLRDLQPEEMDDPQLPEDVHLAALKGLARLNRFTCVAFSVYRRLSKLAVALRRPIRVLDVATGSGDMPIYWAKRAFRDGLAMHCTGLDISDTALKFATAQGRQARADVQFLQRDVLADRLPTGFDIITCGLFIHHLTPPQISRLLQSMQSAAGHAVVVCDLERTRMNLALVSAAAHGLTRSKIVHRDAARSVRAALTRDEFREIAEVALDRPVRVEGLPPCRFIATIEEAVERMPDTVLAGIQTT